MPSPIPPPSTRHVLSPLLYSLPAAAVSSSPPAALLPTLTPILRQRVQLLSAASNEPWLPLLCYDTSKSSQLSSIAKSDKFEPHPVSGEVEVDWDTEVETRYRRIDEETLQAFVAIKEFEIQTKLLWCTGDQEGGGDGWRIGEVSVLEKESIPSGWVSIDEAEVQYEENKNSDIVPIHVISPGGIDGGSWQHVEEEEVEEEDDDAYWAQYDNTPARSPATKRSPAPDSFKNGLAPAGAQNDEDAYYAQYASVQPAMDNHDPDEAAQNGEVETTLGGDDVTTAVRRDLDTSQNDQVPESARAWSGDTDQVSAPIVSSDSYSPILSPAHINSNNELVQPRPTSSNGSHGSHSSSTVERLEGLAEGLGQSETGVKQHISRSTRSLFLLARSAGIDRAEFSRIVQREMDVLCMLDDQE
jgi:hypothetical protein